MLIVYISAALVILFYIYRIVYTITILLHQQDIIHNLICITKKTLYQFWSVYILL